ncbi:MAG: methyltransferase domain-containing protein [Burkholderiaceae bacterium]
MTTQHSASIIALSRWFRTPAGRYVLEWETTQFDQVVADIFGFNAVQVGLLELPALRNNRMPFIFAADEPAVWNQRRQGDPSLPLESQTLPAWLSTSLLTSFEELPFAAQSVDLLVLPHALEFADDPHQVLREVERVLIPEGQVVITGFNPVSLWGLRQTFGRVVDRPFLPRAGQFLGLPRLKDWLKLLGFEVNRGRFGCYRPPFRSEKWMGRLGFMEYSGDRWWPICGAVYMISAVKRVPGMRLVGPAWKERIPAAPALAPTTQRGPIQRVETRPRVMEEQ